MPLPILALPDIPVETIIGQMSFIEQFEFSLISKRCTRIIQTFGAFRKAVIDVTVQANKRIVLEEGGEELMEFSMSNEPMDWCEPEDYESRMIEGVRVGMKKQDDRWLMFIPGPESSIHKLPLSSLFSHVTRLLRTPTIRNFTLDFDETQPSLRRFYLSLTRVENLNILSMRNRAHNTVLTHFKKNVEVSNRFTVNLRHRKDKNMQFCGSPMKTKVLIVQNPTQFFGNFFITNCEQILIEKSGFSGEDFEALIYTWHKNTHPHRLKSVAIKEKDESDPPRLEKLYITKSVLQDYSDRDRSEVDIIITRSDSATASVIDSPKHFSFWAFS